MTDAQTYCSQFFPLREEVAHCLQRNRLLISEACRNALANFKEDKPAGQDAGQVKEPPQKIPLQKKPSLKPPLKKPLLKKPALKKPSLKPPLKKPAQKKPPQKEKKPVP